MATQTVTELETLRPQTRQDLQDDTRTAYSLHSGDDQSARQYLSKNRSIIVMVQLGAINFMTSISNGLITVALPTMAKSLDLDEGLLLWPSAAYYLSSGTCLLLAGTLADVIGARSVNLTGCFFVALFTLASGLSQTGIQLIMFRAMQGVAMALTFPSSVSILSTSIESGKRRNIGFASLGLAMPLGFSFGLIIGGLLVTGAGWRSGFYIGGAASFLLFAIGLWALPASIKSPQCTSVWQRLSKEIDWIGALIASSCLALLSYVLAALSSDIAEIKRPLVIAFLVIGVLLVPAFIMWMTRREKLGKPALIPNSLWKKREFTTICIMVLLSNAVVNCIELYSSLFFQEVQHLSALQTSLRILPSLVVGILLNLAIGTFVHKTPVLYAILISSVLCAGSPLLMALINPRWPYWYAAFFAQLLAPLSIDILFTIGLLIVSDVFPERTQALAGAVFNTVAQLGSSIGLTTTSVISMTVTKDAGHSSKASSAALMDGYRATFWTLVAWMAAACIVGGFGLRKIGKVGEKRE